MFTAWLLMVLFEIGLVRIPVALVAVPKVAAVVAVLVLPPVIVTPAPPVPPRAVPVVTTVGWALGAACRPKCARI